MPGSDGMLILKGGLEESQNGAVSLRSEKSKMVKQSQEL